jgi:uncharacterized damage-inducible protein DinB
MRTVSKLAALLALAVATPALAEDAATALYKSSFEASYNAAIDKITKLFGAFSDEQLNWRPSEKVLTTREVILHVAAGNYYLGGKLGAKLPDGIDLGNLVGPNATRAEIQAAFDKSVEFARAAVAELSAADLAGEMEFFGQKASRERFSLILVEHTHEHLGQLIAYARSNDVVPPWSR